MVTRMFVTYGFASRRSGSSADWPSRSSLTRLMTSLLFGISALDPITYGLVCFSLLGAAMLASYVPALRATMVNPVTALRAD